MEKILPIIIITLFILFLFLLFLILILIFISIIKKIFIINSVPFVPTSKSILDEILEVMKIEENKVIYDLGCGNGRFIFYAAKKYPKSFFIGIENDSFAYFWAKVIQWFKKYPNVKIKNGDFFKENIDKASYIYIYLFPGVLKELSKKFRGELKNTFVFSLDFKIPDKEPIKIIEIKKNKIRRKRTIYVYYYRNKKGSYLKE